MNRTNPRRRAARPAQGQPKAKKPGKRTSTRKRRTSAAADKTIILAMSSGAANELRTTLARSRTENKEIRAMQAELEDQLGGLPERKRK